MNESIFASPQFQYLVEELGSEEEVKKTIKEYITPFMGLVTFEIGCEIKAAEHGWQNPNKPRPVYMSHLAPEYLETRKWRYSQDGNTAYATVSIMAVIKDISALDAYDYTDNDGEDHVQQYVDVTFEDEGLEARVRMTNSDAFVSASGKAIMASHMCTLWDNFRSAVGRRVKVSGVSVKRSQDFNGGETYSFSSGNFTKVVKILEDEITEEDFLEDGGL